MRPVNTTQLLAEPPFTIFRTLKNVNLEDLSSRKVLGPLQMKLPDALDEDDIDGEPNFMCFYLGDNESFGPFREPGFKHMEEEHMVLTENDVRALAHWIGRSLQAVSR